MNRKIKFRAWQKYHKQMLDVTNIGFRDGEIYSLTVEYPEGTIPRFVTYGKDYDKFWLDDDCIKLMQYTGLKDKNGKEIYEGDIIKEFNYSGDECRVSEVVWDGTLATGWHKKIIKDLTMPKGYGQEGISIGIEEREVKDFEVIGNIYENPELLDN